MSIVVNSPSHRCEIAELFIRDAATLCATLLRSVRSHYDLATTNTLPRRLCYLANIGASVTLPLRSLRLANYRPCSSALLKLLSLFWILEPILSSSIVM